MQLLILLRCMYIAVADKPIATYHVVQLKQSFECVDLRHIMLNVNSLYY